MLNRWFVVRTDRSVRKAPPIAVTLVSGLVMQSAVNPNGHATLAVASCPDSDMACSPAHEISATSIGARSTASATAGVSPPLMGWLDSLTPAAPDRMS